MSLELVGGLMMCFAIILRVSQVLTYFLEKAHWSNTVQIVPHSTLINTWKSHDSPTNKNNHTHISLHCFNLDTYLVTCITSQIINLNYHLSLSKININNCFNKQPHTPYILTILQCNYEPLSTQDWGVLNSLIML